MNYQIIFPPESLRSYVRYFWSLKSNGRPPSEWHLKTFVDDSSGIIVQHKNGKPVFLKDNELIPEAFIYGQSTAPTLSFPISDFTVFGVLFHPHTAHELFHTPAFHFSDNMIHLNEILSPDITDMLLEENEVERQARLLFSVLEKKIYKVNHIDTLIRNCIRRINVFKGGLAVRELLNFYRVSERQLERRFNHVVGVSPRHFIKIARFKEAVNQFRAKQGLTLTEIAYLTNYTDQSHFIRHVKQLSGLTPKELQRNLHEAPVNLML